MALVHKDTGLTGNMSMDPVRINYNSKAKAFFNIINLVE